MTLYGLSRKLCRGDLGRRSNNISDEGEHNKLCCILSSSFLKVLKVFFNKRTTQVDFVHIVYMSYLTTAYCYFH